VPLLEDRLIEATDSTASPGIEPLPAGTRLVHIGPPKTGTTTLQAAFHARRAEVLAQGVRYAGRARHSGAAVLAVTERPSFQQDEGPPPIGRWRALAGEVRHASEPRVLVSSEFFADGEAAVIPRIVEDLGGDRLHVVATLRPLARILPSQWQQYVQSGMRLSYDDWLTGIFNDPDRVTPTFWRRHRHDALVDRWAAVVGPRNVTVVVIDEHDHEHVLRVFEQLLGLTAGTLVADEDLTNRSMTLPEIEAVRAFNIAFKNAGLGNALFHKVMHFGAAAYMRERRPAADEPRIETPQWALDRAAAVARGGVDHLAGSGVRVIGDLESLAVVPKSRLAGERQPPVSIPPEIAARMAMGVLVVAGMARRSRRSEGAGPSLRDDLGPMWLEPPELARHPTMHLVGAVGGRVLTAGRRRVHAVRRRLAG
jgi:hypothetical protein